MLRRISTGNICQIFRYFWQKVKSKKETKNLNSLDRRPRLPEAVDRPSAAEYIDAILMISWNFMVIRGVRDDNAIIGGIATLDGQPVTVIGIRKGHTTKEKHQM